MTNNVTERTVKETVTAGADVLFSAEVSLGKAGVESQERMPKLGTDAFAVQCRNLDHRSLAYRFIKRIFDFMFSVCVVVIGFLPGLILSLAIVVDTKGSPIYSQARIGRLGQTFRIYKFLAPWSPIPMTSRSTWMQTSSRSDTANAKLTTTRASRPSDGSSVD